MEIKTSYLTQEQIDEILEAASNDIKNDIVASAKADVKNRIQWTIEEQVKKDVTEWYKENVSNDIKVALATQKETIVSTAVSFAEDLALELAKAYTAQISSVMSDSWKRREVFKALFGV